jgi:RNA polymerase sigma factor (sigma-70 family)
VTTGTRGFWRLGLVASRQSGAALREFRTLFHVGTTGDLTDGQLLERFVTGRGEAPELAFASLVDRHAALVLGVCRAVLRDDYDAQDAFQATFLVLLRKARRLWVEDSLGPWLHQVAYRAACSARAARTRRRMHERHAAEMASLEVAAAGNPEDLGRVLHEEIERLPARFHFPVVLCDLEGCTHERAARHLGCPVGTVKSRLARGRELLRSRLVRRGLGPSGGPIGEILAAESAQAAVPIWALAGVTAQAARRLAAGQVTGAVQASVAALADRVIRITLLTNMIGIASVGLSILAVAVGAGVLVQERPEPQVARIQIRLSEAEGTERVAPTRPEGASPGERESPQQPFATPKPARPAREPGSRPQPFATLDGHRKPVWTVVFSPDGKTLATGGNQRGLDRMALRALTRCGVTS